mmetsp:Transcript_10424/g.33336  ORF Transcript_10424/g.33336 Transcript_10424/m.33336 type:complete len:237 (+) Transcript_10424:65-775(+)|eukprot:CAMPEP_0197393792 /NCGR_PEP_ID=MMETSP1165-20131217/4517_1 /TAXON_ID=284809 /ORGANISM="Chrysocystis fragilis, Strain CCMP3189" /LENGTH=236 /DNA_ID=CAMNT_0042919469 /DNA_START=62 /DNA_END=772 /DNA_ORIENTATION=+
MSEMLAKAQGSRAAAESKSLKLGIVENTAAYGAGAGGGFGLNAPGAGPKVKHFAGATNGKKSVAVPPEIFDAWNKVLDDDQAETFLVATYAPSGKALDLKCVGTEGLAAFKAQLPEDQVAWGGFKCLAVDDRGNVVCKRPKFVFVQHMPAAASAMKKAKMATHKGAVKEALHSAHLDVSVEDITVELADLDLVKKLQAATGAHKPNGYEFEKDVFVADDYYGLGIGKNCKAESATA